MKYTDEGGFAYLNLEAALNAEQETWLLENVGAMAQMVPPKSYQVLARWWPRTLPRYSSLRNSNGGGRVFAGYLYQVGFRNRADAMKFKLTWQGQTK